MTEIKESRYKYLKVLEGAHIKHREMKDKIEEEYFRRVKLVTKPKLQYLGSYSR